jgi:hypothetical protein
MKTKKSVIPDRTAYENVERQYPAKTDAEKYRLAQADTLLRLTGATDIDEFNRMAKSGELAILVRAHNRRMRGESITIVSAVDQD